MVLLFRSCLNKIALMASAMLFLPVDYGIAAPAQNEHMMLRFVSSDRIADPSRGFSEVSGLSLSDNGGFWAVSDDTARLFRLDDAGKVRRKESLRALPGLEGVAFDAAGGRILAVREGTSEILDVAQDGRLTRHPILAMEGAASLAELFAENNTNDGLEGITIDPKTGTVFVVKERGPRLLIEIAPDLSHVRKIMPLTVSAGFVSDRAEDDHLDVSGLAWDGQRQGLWITSDTGQALYFFCFATMKARGWALMREAAGKSRRVANAEGVALSLDGQTIFIVTDDGKDSRLLTYRIH
jgi:uncharacterized protein YjiK